MRIFDNMTLDLDAAKEFSVYYPELNYGEVMEKINRKSARKRKKMKSVSNFMLFMFSPKKPQNLKSPTKKKVISTNCGFFGKEENLVKRTNNHGFKNRKKNFRGGQITEFMRIVKLALQKMKAALFLYQ